MDLSQLGTVLLIPALLLAVFAQFKVSSTFNKYSKVNAESGYTGREVARMILDRNGLEDVEVVSVAGNLTDHYDPRTRVVRLSEGVYNKTSISAISVAAHEVGHAVQDKEEYVPLTIRTSLVPAVNFASQSAFIILFIGIFMSQFRFLINVGIALFAVTVIFQIITLPVEFNASSRALENLEGYGILARDEVGEGKSVLQAAALTYVASTLMALVQLIRLLGMRRRD
ncbi:zinc metallopeptidase [Miniphocaeibacter massiliensis]|uniref:zinc metallopeptidase n=1 Tax=Miniphocaeibacter massiliensis TaxID=2041841 RepID=UPI000C068ABD|nr:zinc metallopeptidase [Miniphocaeibacter massiliensis]